VSKRLAASSFVVYVCKNPSFPKGIEGLERAINLYGRDARRRMITREEDII